MTTRDVRLGPLRFPTIEGDAKETLGDALEQIGAVALPGERRARPFPLSLPIHGISTDGNQYLAVGQRLRRQVRALVENPKARAELLWFEFAVDTDLNAWVLVGGGDLSYTEQGTTFADYLLELTDCYKAGDRNTHRPARRLIVRDRRLSTEPRDTLGLIRSTDFAGLSSLARHWLPVNASDLLGARGTTLPQGIAVPTADGSLQLVVGRANSDVLSYEQASADDGRAGVLVRDRKGTLGYGYTLTQRGLPAPSAYWRLSETAGATSTDQSGNGRTLTAAGGITKDQPGATLDGSGSWLLDGVNGRGTTTYNPFTAGAALTVAGWAYRRTNGTADALFGGDAAATPAPYLRALAGGNDLAFSPQSGSGTTTWAGACPLGQWFHWALVFTDTGAHPVALYINGVLISSQNTGFSYSATPGNIILGNRTNATVDPFDGYLEDVAVWAGTALTATQITTLYQAGLQTADPEASFGWENLYGPSQLVTAGDVPIIENARCRVRYDATNTPGFRVDVWDGTKWAEQGKMLVQRRGASNAFDDTLVSASVYEWTQERAVLKVVMRLSTDTASREVVYITLQRGWSGPRFEVYPALLAGGTAASAGFRYVAAGTPVNDTLLKLDSGDVAAAAVTAGSGSTFFTGATLGAATFTGENHLSLTRQGQAYDAVLSVLQAAAAASTAAGGDTSAYGVARNAVVVTAAAAAGYASVHLGFHAQQADQMMEAEAMTLGAGSAISADGGASGGQMVSTARTTDANPHVTRANWLTAAKGKYRVFARVANGTNNMNVYAKTTATTGATKVKTIGGYGIVDLGEIVADGSTLEIHAWAGSGSSIVDRIEAVKVEDRTAAAPAYDGARDHGQATLADSRQCQRLLPRAS